MNDNHRFAALILGALLLFPLPSFANPPAVGGADVVVNSVTPVSAADIIRHGRPEKLSLRSRVALVWDDREGVPLYGRAVDQPRSIASLTKLMTAVVILDAGLPLDELIQITTDDRDTFKRTTSHLPVGAVFSRYDLLHAALASSDNRAAAALGRTWPGGLGEFVRAMNDKAVQLGMAHTRFVEPTGLLAGNVSTARDLVKLINAARGYHLIRAFSTDGEYTVLDRAKGRTVWLHNTNRLLRGQESSWDIGLSKTGYTAAAGRCLVMQANIAGRPLTIVLLNSSGKLTRYGDVARIRSWLKNTEQRILRTTAALPAGG